MTEDGTTVTEDEPIPAQDLASSVQAPMSRFVDLWRGEGDGRRFSIGRDLFLRFVGLAAFFASLSLAVQVEALYGSEGILPFVDFLDWSRDMAAGDRTAMLVRAPTLLWFLPTDGMLVGLAWTSVVASLLLIAGIAPRATVPVIWVSYASILAVGRVFLSFQWDALLLETLVVAWFIAPWRLVMRPEPLKSGWIGRWAAIFLLFKLIFLSGWVKLASGDPAWSSDFSAMSYHFWTQPLPTWTAYYADMLPGFVLSATTFVVVFGELIIPFLLFGPRRVRLVAAVALIVLQLGIAATGNYGFFNLLALSLSLVAIDDRAWRSLPVVGARLGRWAADHTARLGRRERIATGLICAILLGASATGLLGRVAPGALELLPERARLFLRTTRSFNGYGLFAVMTKDRREISIELSRDGETWEPVVFRYKPGALDERPGFIGPHMPRLDWQMWFAGLGECGRNSWLIYTARELVEQNPAVIERFDSVPRGDDLRYARFPSYQYRFGDETWWTRREAGTYCPTLDFSGGEIRQVDL